MGREPRGEARAAAVLIALVVAVVGLTAGCATSERADRVDRLQPLDDTGPASAGGSRPARPASPTPPPDTDPPTSTPPTTRSNGSPPASPARRSIDDLLARYDRALTDLAAHPETVGDPRSPVRAAFDAVVTPGTALADDVTGAIVSRHRDGVVVVPPATGLSYRHRALVTQPADDGSVSFTWCGWSPGIGRDDRSGAVVDDGVAHAHGTGRARGGPGGWVLDALDQTDLDVLAPRSADPCPAEATGSTATAVEGP
jgi:hypothetical protein